MVMDNQYKNMGLVPETSRHPDAVIVIKVTNPHDDRWPTQKLFQPVDGSQMKLFMHCTGGLIAATAEFIKAYRSVFENHGIEIIMEEVDV